MKHAVMVILVALGAIALSPVPVAASATDPARPVARRGCCSHHKGVCGCTAHVTICCDGDASPTCTC